MSRTLELLPLTCDNKAKGPGECVNTPRPWPDWLEPNMSDRNTPTCCLTCGIPLTQKTKGRLRFYCSRQCRVDRDTTQRRNSKPQNPDCLYCGNPIPQVVRRDAVYCQPECRAQHYAERRRKPSRGSFEERFWSQVDKEAALGCWVWTGGKLASGYGSVALDGTRFVTHRVVWEMLRGPIPDGLQIDHLCRNRACCNPDHLEPVEQKTNLLRGVSQPAINARKTHCIRGHEFTPENTYRRPGCPQARNCRTCIEIRKQQYKARRAA